MEIYKYATKLYEMQVFYKKHIVCEEYVLEYGGINVCAVTERETDS